MDGNGKQPTSDLGNEIAQLVDAATNERLGVLRRRVKALGDDVAELKARPQIDPVALLREAIGSAKTRLSEIDAAEAAKMEEEMNPKATTSSEESPAS